MFCDKTGTLTKNELVFKNLAIDGIIYESINDIKSKMDILGTNVKF